jgi:hypothetical protein
VTDNDIPKHDKELFIAMNEDGDTDYGPTVEQALGRLDKDFAGNLIRVVRVMVHMTPPTVEDCGDVIIPDAAGSKVKFDTRDR